MAYPIGWPRGNPTPVTPLPDGGRDAVLTAAQAAAADAAGVVGLPAGVMTTAQVAAAQAVVSGAWNAPAVARVTLLGDSLSAMGNQLLTPTSISRSAGVATVTLSAHGLATGTKIRAFGFRTTPDFDSADAAVTRIDANSFSYPSTGADGAGTVDATYSRISAKGWFSNICYFGYANSALRGALTLVDNLGQSSEVTADMLARVSEAAESACDVVVYLGGSNDVVGSTTATTTISNDAAIVDALLAAGKIVVICTIPPLGSGHAAFATATPKINQVNAAKRALASASKGRVRLADFHAALVDPASGAAKTSALQSDNVHWQTYGARLAGVELAAALTGVPQGRFLTTSIADARATYATSPNIWPVGQFTQADAGTKAGPANAASPPGGSIAGVLDGYNVTATAGSGEVWIAPDADGYGYAQVVSWTPSGAAAVTVQQESAATMAALVTAGERYRIGFHLKVAGVTNALTYLRCRVQGVFDGVTMAIGSPMHSMVAGSGNVGSDFDEYIVGPEMVIPPGACTSLTVEVIANFSGATTQHTITVSRMTVNRVA